VELLCQQTITVTATSNANESHGIFDIPSKSAEELKSIVDELPALRLRANNKNGYSNSNTKRKVSLKEDLGFGVGPKTAVPRSPEQKAQERILKAKRHQERRNNAKELIAKHQPEPGVLAKMNPHDVRKVYGNAIKADPSLEEENHHWLRDLGGSYAASENPSFLASTSEYYDPFQQGYRMLGGFIDCDHGQDGSGSGDNNNNGGNNNGDETCSRWMMWAAYINPNYGGGGRDEYFNYASDDDAAYGYNYGYDTSSSGSGNSSGNNVNGLDCHSPNTEWELVGVYREEFYQYIEQISKHLWAIDDYEYVVALAGLAYMTDSDCAGVGNDSNGNYLYAGIMPYSGGMYAIGLYTDDVCLIPDTQSGLTYDDFGQTSDLDLGSEDDGCLDDDTLNTLYGYWEATQEYTLELLNEVYSEFKYCTLCMDYPTYQDGYFIGDSGTDDDDMINQCWKFHSHDSYTCETDCLALGDAQGSILQISYAGRTFGTSWDGSSSSGNSKVYDHYAKGYTSNNESKLEKFKANAYLTFNGVFFIATFLAFSVARGSRLDSSDKSRSLLPKNRKKMRSSSRKKSSSSRSKSASARSKSASGRSKSSSGRTKPSASATAPRSAPKSRSRSRK